MGIKVDKRTKNGSIQLLLERDSVCQLPSNFLVHPQSDQNSQHEVRWLRDSWRNVLLEMFGYSVLGGCVFLMLVFLIGILLVGEVVLYEPCRIILFAEIVLVCFGLMFLLKKFVWG